MSAFISGCLVVLSCVAGTCAARTNAAPRIVSFSPALTEMLYAIGAEDMIVGVADFSTYPPAAKTKPRVGGIANPSFERIESLSPTLVVVQGTMPAIRSFCANRDIDVAVLAADTWAEITNTMMSLGARLDRVDAARNAVRRMDAQWRDVAARRPAVPVPAFVSLWRGAGAVSSAGTVSPRSFIDQALTLAGGSNVCGDVAGAYPTVAAEVLCARRPRVIFDMRPGEILSPGKSREITAAWNTLFADDAAPHVVIVSNSCAMIPGPRLPQLAEIFLNGVTRTAEKPHAH